ncbi:FecCD family ABC transporter permease [Nesterenkonia ebinurensis]|uniref:FecCD family ABC transporter permease n=1 Tax=Nesterenkonia ebinurensis TaxID=2608252 RepID=UPI00123D613E|nr:iron chelate uptake ABC transporter family permease subunit [Nesterenkonia ebinurensis]
MITAGRTLWLAFALISSLLLCALSISVGSRSIGLTEVWQVLLHPQETTEGVVVMQLRVPRTVIAVVVGAALAVAGVLMQSLTRNPLADPGILGINAGASLAVVMAVAITGIASITFYLWFAFLGAAAAAVGVYLLGSVGRQSATPARLALAGVAITAALSALVQTIILTNQEAFNEFRFWTAGSLEGRGLDITAVVAPFIAAGALCALALAPTLNALALGDETGAALGVRIRRTRALTFLAVTLLCGAGTAAVGPIAFVGLGIPYLARAAVGPDLRWAVPMCLLLGPAMLLAADIFGRVIITPQEVQAGIITALFGAPVFIAIVRRRRIEAV